jgi:CDP-diacylglycerol---serine O-phosphatidyltransferase
MRKPRVSMLASLCTLGNALCGFGAITLTAKAILLQDTAPARYEVGILWAGYLVILAMVFDALDGRVARFARATSDFGGQLDSLADAISFGLAPAFIMNRVVVETLNDFPSLAPERVLWIAWVGGAVYLGCALIRLARFNVENVHEEEAHLSFKGLPSPAAAGALVALVVAVVPYCERFHAAALQDPPIEPNACTLVLLWMLPAAAAVLGLLMVSNLRYLHLLNQVIRGRRPINHLVLTVLAIAAAVLMALWLKELILAVGFVAYALSGPVLGVVRRLGGKRWGKPRPPDLFSQRPDDALP